MNSKGRIFILDDDEAVRSSVSLLLQTAGLEPCACATPEEFLGQCQPGEAGCLLLDIRMPGVNGLDILESLGEHGLHLPVIMLTGHGDVPAAVRALKHGALDFFQKPFDDQALLDAVNRALDIDAQQRSSRNAQAEVRERLGNLTPREREVLDLVVAGKANKVIAIDLGISERTVELHRTHIMKKMQARSVAELVQMVVREAE